MKFQKGKSGNPKGRPPILHPEVMSAVDRSKNEIKMLLIKLLNMSDEEFDEHAENRRIPKTEKLFIRCIKDIEFTGNIEAYRKLLEILLGKLPEEPQQFALSIEEKMIVLEFRKRLELINGGSTIQNGGGDTR